VEPSGKFTATEREEFIRATQMLATRYEQHQRDSQDVKVPGRRKPYKTWSEHEMYTLSVSWLLLRASVSDMAECNKGAQSVWHSGFVLGTLPSCLLRMRSLNTLHLSGSGLTGSLPAVANISAVLADLTLSHNLLTGKIAGSFLNRDWDKLDLSYNRLT
jgi:hypothetical protein